MTAQCFFLQFVLLNRKYGGQYLYIACYSWCFIVSITTSPRCIQNRFNYCDKFERHSTIHFKYSLFIFFKLTILINGLSRNAIQQEPMQHSMVLLQIPLLRQPGNGSINRRLVPCQIVTNQLLVDSSIIVYLVFSHIQPHVIGFIVLKLILSDQFHQ